MLISFQEIKDADFVVCIMSQFQRETLQQCLELTRYLSIDATHSTTKYGFKLITILVKDKTDRGVPVAHCISAKEDTNALYVFFKELRKQLGQIVVDYVLTDDAKQVCIKKCRLFKIW